MSTYILKDPTYDNEVSKINNFSRQWSKYYPHVKISLYDLEFKDDDIIIVNLYGGDPYGTHKIPDSCKKIFIVHTVNKDNVKFIDDADYVIYLNDIQKQLVEDIVGIHKPSYVSPRHPTHSFNTTPKQQDSLFIGGWFFSDRIDKLTDRIIELNKSLPVNINFEFYPVWGNSNKLIDEINEFFKNIQENVFKYHKRNILINNSELFYDIMLFKTRISKYAFLWDNSPSIDEIKSLLNSKNEEILNYSIGESSMLAILESSPKKLFVEDHIKFLSYFDKKGNFTFEDFSKLIEKSIKAIS